MSLPNRLRDEKPPSISYTAITRFESCQWMERLLREGKPRAYPDRRVFLVGNVVHKAVELSLQAGQRVRGVDLLRIFNEQAAKPGVRWQSRTDARELLERAVTTFVQVWPVIRKEAEASKLVEIESEYEVIPYGHSFKAHAKIDLIFRREKDLVWDLKTSYRPTLDERQLWWYAGVIYYSRPPTKRYVPECAFLHPTASGQAKVVPVPVAVENVRAAFNIGAVVCDAIEDMFFKPDPEPWKCSRCRARPSCQFSAFTGHRGRPLARVPA